MGKGGEETATRPRREDFFYSEQVFIFAVVQTVLTTYTAAILIFAFRQGACENMTSAQLNMLI